MPRVEDDPIRTIEISEPDLEFEGLRFLTVYSPSLKARGDITVHVPPALTASASAPIVLLLHGVYGSHWAWFLKGAAHRTSSQLLAAGRIRPMLLASSSDGLFQDGSGYLAHSGHDFETWITTDVIGALRRSFPFIDENSSIFIAGLSMGGYGALRLGAKHATMFQGISAHSAITDIAEMASFVFDPFPIGEIADRQDEILYWIEKNRKHLPAIRFDCGIADPLLEGNRRFHYALLQRQVHHQYVEFTGAHEWSYWRTHLADSILFFEGLLSGR
jgi:enterochelin esterase-like enzyme